MSEWISVKNNLPPCDGNNKLAYSLALHSIHGIGVCWFYILDKGNVEEMEEDFEDKYICSGHFIKK